MNILKTIVTCLAFWAMTGCSELLNVKNHAPVLSNAIAAISVAKNGSVEIELKHVEAYDANGDVMTLEVLDSENKTYTRVGNVVSPLRDFVGTIWVLIRVTDSNGASSAVKKIAVNVFDVEKGSEKQILPLTIGLKWDYLDSFHTLNKVDTSSLTVKSLYTGTVTGVKGPIFRLRWSGLSGIKGTNDTVDYLFSNSDSGLIQVGGASSTVVYDYSPMLFARYPVSAKSSWKYQNLEYNTEMQRFFLDTTMNSISCVIPETVVRVPAGVFLCVHYQYETKYLINKSEKRLISVPVSNRADTLVTLNVNLYYCPGVGYVKNETFIGATKVFTKVLNKNPFEEKI